MDVPDIGFEARHGIFEQMPGYVKIQRDNRHIHHQLALGALQTLHALPTFEHLGLVALGQGRQMRPDHEDQPAAVRQTQQRLLLHAQPQVSDAGGLAAEVPDDAG